MLGVEPTELRLRDRKREQRDPVGFLEIRAKLLDGQSGGGAILDTVFEQLAIVIAHVARDVV